MKKILILFSSGDIGGAERSLTRMSSKGEVNEFLLGSLVGDGSVLQSKINSNSYINKFGFKKASIIYLILSCIKAIIFSKKENVDILYICGFKACAIIRLFSIFTKTPKIIHAIRWNPISNNLDDKIFRIFEKFFVFKTHGWVCNSKSAVNTLILNCKLPKEKIIFIYNGIEINKKQSSKKCLEQNFILTLSNFAKRKGILEYLSVIQRVLSKNNKIKFILAGRDDMNGLIQEEIIRRNLSKNILIPGFVNDISKLLDISKIVVMPSILPEGHPTSILESMSYKKPVIGYDIEGVNELVIHNHTGLIVPLLNEKLMAESIIKLIEKPYLIEKYGNNGYTTIIKNFSLNKMIKHHRNYFNSL